MNLSGRIARRGHRAEEIRPRCRVASSTFFYASSETMESTRQRSCSTLFSSSSGSPGFMRGSNGANSVSSHSLATLEKVGKNDTPRVNGDSIHHQETINLCNSGE